MFHDFRDNKHYMISYKWPWVTFYCHP